uniref:Uncharacterized protein n=1 Tax=Opuntia streptacantha TaxID=393608 RepID=A0A7C8Z2K5_OPUST
MVRHLSAWSGTTGGGSFEVHGTSGGLLALLCVIIVSVSVISMVIFGCIEDDPKKRHREICFGIFDGCAECADVCTDGGATGSSGGDNGAGSSGVDCDCTGCGCGGIGD